ncbi:nuclear speckle splicing regulatory protein 1 [Biomphalaria glabrata]|nr:nuclear speckle splicing regulatory protein 1-like; partial [Biomphalaria glabrata]
MADKNKKTYGLIIPKKTGQVTQKSKQSSFTNVFGNESDEESDTKQTVTSAKKNSGYTGPSTVKRQTQMDIDKALQEDPTVYEYDSIYDDLQATKPQVGAKEKSSAEKKPRYISGLLMAAEAKKKEEERRKERQVQKEREAEGEMFADKEKFVTSAYKQKMLEMAEAEEKEKREAAMENMLDVTKQKDISGFYRYLYRTTTGTEAVEINKENLVKQEPIDDSLVPLQSKSNTTELSDSESNEGSDKSPSDAKTKVEFSKPNRPQQGGRFRQHRSNSSSPETDRRSSKRSAPTPPQNSDVNNHERESSSHHSHRRSRSRSSSMSPARNYQKSSSFQSSENFKRKSREQSRSRSRDRAQNKKSSDKHNSRKSRRHSSPYSDKSNAKSSPPTDGPKDDSLLLPNDKENKTENNTNVKVQLDSDKPKKLGMEKKPIDPRDKKYPHHNTPKDIAEARKRYLQRKIAREMAG